MSPPLCSSCIECVRRVTAASLSFLFCTHFIFLLNNNLRTAQADNRLLYLKGVHQNFAFRPSSDPHPVAAIGTVSFSLSVRFFSFPCKFRTRRCHIVLVS